MLIELIEHLDMWNLMAYDFSGTWSQRATHQANLFPTQVTDASVDAAIQFYTSHGVSPAKLVLGMPLYARAFAKTDGLGAPFKGVPHGGAEPGNFFYNVSNLQVMSLHLLILLSLRTFLCLVTRSTLIVKPLRLTHSVNPSEKLRLMTVHRVLIARSTTFINVV